MHQQKILPHLIVQSAKFHVCPEKAGSKRLRVGGAPIAAQWRLSLPLQCIAAEAEMVILPKCGAQQGEGGGDGKI